jgi:hypothetical protein
MSARGSRRDNTDRSLARSASSKELSRKYGMIGRSYPRGISRRLCALFLKANRCAHLRESHRTIRERLFWGGAVPRTSCQATIAPSIRDISQQALARDGLRGWNRVEWRRQSVRGSLVPATRETADDENEGDSRRLGCDRVGSSVQRVMGAWPRLTPISARIMRGAYRANPKGAKRLDLRPRRFSPTQAMTDSEESVRSER